MLNVFMDYIKVCMKGVLNVDIMAMLNFIWPFLKFYLTVFLLEFEHILLKWVGFHLT